MPWPLQESATLVFFVRYRVAGERGVPHPLRFICDLFAGYDGAIRGELHALRGSGVVCEHGGIAVGVVVFIFG